jgi:hypothetical protein
MTPNFLRRNESPPELPPTVPMKLPEHDIENEIRQLVRQRPNKRDPLSPEAAELMSAGMTASSDKLIDETEQAMARLEAEVTDLRARVNAFIAKVRRDTAEVNEMIAAHHATFRETAQRLGAIVDPPTTGGNWGGGGTEPPELEQAARPGLAAPTDPGTASGGATIRWSDRE